MDTQKDENVLKKRNCDQNKYCKKPEILNEFLNMSHRIDHWFLRSTRLSRRHKTVIPLAGNRGLCLTCNKHYYVLVNS